MTRPLLLLVDDAPDVAVIVHRLGKWLGHDVISFPDVPSAWEYLSRCINEESPAETRPQRPDLVVVDINLPGLSGLDLCRRLRATPALAGQAVALFGSWERISDIAAGLQAGIDFVLAKELLAQPDAWRKRLGEILAVVDGRPAWESISCLRRLVPAQPDEKWREIILQIINHPTVQRLGQEVLPVITHRASQQSQRLFPSGVAADEFFTEVVKLNGSGVAPLKCPKAMQEFALALVEQLGRLLGTAASEPLRLALREVLARPTATEPMKPVHAILLVEDNPADVKITERALQESGSSVELLVVRDGQEALDYLLRQGSFAGSSDWRSPDLILLDLNLPRLTGLQVIERIRATPELKAVPVVVLTTSRRPEDIQELYAAGANTYIEKPQEFNRFVEVLQTIQSYWLGTALLPEKREG